MRASWQLWAFAHLRGMTFHLLRGMQLSAEEVATLSEIDVPWVQGVLRVLKTLAIATIIAVLWIAVSGVWWVLAKLWGSMHMEGLT